MRLLAAWIAALAALLVLDAIWLGVAMPGFYARELGPLLLDSPRWDAAAAFYLLYSFGLVVLAVRPGAPAQSWSRVIGRSALFGCVAYATYDLSNLATLRGWPPVVAAVDIAWGIVISGAAGAAARLVARRGP